MNTRPFLNSEYYESNSWFYKPSKSRVLLQGTVHLLALLVTKHPKGPPKVQALETYTLGSFGSQLCI